MSTTGQRRTRAQRVAAHVAYEGIFDRAEELLVANHGLTKIGLVLLTTFLLCLITQAWKAPFKFTLYEKVDRDIVCKTPFSVISEAKTIEARRNARLDTPIIYCNDASKIKALKMNLENTIQSFLRNESYEAMPLEEKQKWKSQFLPTGVSDDAAAAAFKNLQNVFEKDPDLNRFKESMDRVFMPFEKNGILLKLHGARDGNQEKIVVYDIGTEPNTGRETAVRDVLIGNAYQIKEWLNREFDREIAEMLFQRIRPIVPETLTENHDETVKAQNRAEERVQPVSVNYEPGQVLVKINSILELDMLTLLKAEHLAYLAQRTFAEKITRFTGVLILAMCMLLLTYFMACGAIFRSGRQLTLGNMGTVFTLMIITTLIGKSIQMLMYNQGASPELMPIVMYAQTVSIAFSWEIAVISSFIIVFLLVLSGLSDLGLFLSLLGTATVIAVLSRDIKTRTNLVFIALVGGITAFVLSSSIDIIQENGNLLQIFTEAAFRMLWVITAGFLMISFLPVIELMLGILTPMRLLEFGNPSHPLLLELNRRAPATYNHSMQTAAIAEAAAEAIGARSALIRVGAYFHDIGKMLNPDYFTENQSGFNIHNTLEPRMSTLVIVAHVKDGVNLGRQYHLPQPVIDLIEQHHGNMLVSFFYQRARQLAKEHDYSQQLDESSFRYPGPIPQTKEAGILMLADAAESASRSLGEVTPGRIENLVRQISEQRIEDGQFNDSGLTLGEIRTVENSIITSILASRHGRIKYPENFSGKNKEPVHENKPKVSGTASEVPQTSELS